MAFLLLPRARQVSCPKAGLGAPSGRKWGRVHPRGGACGRGAPVSRACESGLRPSPRALAPSPAGRPATAGRRHLQSHPGPRVCSRDDRDFTSPQTGKESGGLEGSPATHSILLASLLCDLGQLISPLWATILGETRWFQDDFLESFLQIVSAFVELTLRAQCVEETGLRPERAYYQLKD